MKVLLTERVRVLQKDPVGSKALRDFIANAKINEPKEINICLQGQEKRFKAKLITQG